MPKFDFEALLNLDPITIQWTMESPAGNQFVWQGFYKGKVDNTFLLLYEAVEQEEDGTVATAWFDLRGNEVSPPPPQSNGKAPLVVRPPAIFENVRTKPTRVMTDEQKLRIAEKTYKRLKAKAAKAKDKS